MARTTVSVSPEVRDILKACPLTNINGAWHLTLTGQLDRKMYEAVNKVLMLAGGKWNRSLKVHIFNEDPSPVLLDAVETGQVVDEKKVLQAYYTPFALASHLVDIAGIKPGMSVLEPSCGKGALAEQVAEILGHWPDCVDIDPKAIAHVAGKGCIRAWTEDFIGWAARTPNRYDRVVMNPPFADRRDIVHVAAAITLLKPGGLVVAIMSPHWTFADDKDSVQFRKALGIHDKQLGTSPRAVWTKNDDNAFAESGTGVNTGILRYSAPATQATSVRRAKPLPAKNKPAYA